MYSSQSRLDTTHQKAIALSEIHKYQEAHDVLQTALQYKKNVRTYSVLVENAVTTFATLCVRLKSPAIRNVLADFRQCAAASHPKSLENVIVQFVQAAEKTAESDLKAITADASSSSSSDEITPEMLMSMAESDPHAIKEHRDRSKSPSVMYLWEAYRYATECIRHTRQLLPLYADLCEKALAAFAKYKRHYEFRRFFSQLRDSRDFSSQPRVPVPVIPSGQPLDPEKQRLKEEQEKMNELNSRLRIRLAQLNTAIALDYWNEVYETISDLHETIPKTMASTCTLPLYTAILERLAHFFWSTNNTLYFAYTLFKLQKIASVYNADPNSPHSVKYLSSNASVLADCTVLAVLSLSPSERTTTDDEFGLQVNEHDNANKFVSFLGLPSESPRRSRLLELLTQEGYLNTISPDVRDLYVALEHSVPALSMRRRAGPALDRIAVDGVYSRFAQQLCAQFVLRLLQRMSNIYSSISMDRLAALAPSQLTWGQLERIILQHASSGAVPVRVDHKEKYVVFVHATLEAPTLRDQLTTVSDALRQIHRNYLSPAVYKDDKDKERKQVFFLVREGMKKDHEAVYERIDYIAKRKEDEENAIREREMQREEEAKAAEEKRIREAEEAKKREAEQKEKEEKERVKREQEAQQRKQVVDYVQKAISAVPEHLLASKRVKQMASLTGKMGTGALKQDELIQAAKRLELEQRADRERRKREDYKKVDYLVRALRMEEQSLLATEHSVKAAEHSKNMAKQMEEEKIRHREHWELASKEKVRLARVEPLRQAHIQHIMAKREEEYKQAMVCIYFITYTISTI